MEKGKGIKGKGIKGIKGKGIKGKEKDENILVTMRCIDMASPTTEVDKAPCAECGEMTWISHAARNIKFDKIICSPCFKKKEENKSYKDCQMCITEECLEEAIDLLKSEGIETSKEKIIEKMEHEIGRKIIIKKKRMG